MVNRGDAVGWGEWKKLPVEQQMGWRIPIEVMLDIPHLRSTRSVVLVSEYLRLQGLRVQQEWASGAWHTRDYHSGSNDQRYSCCDSHFLQDRAIPHSTLSRTRNMTPVLSFAWTHSWPRKIQSPLCLDVVPMKH